MLRDDGSPGGGGPRHGTARQRPRTDAADLRAQKRRRGWFRAFHPSKRGRLRECRGRLWPRVWCREHPRAPPDTVPSGPPAPTPGPPHRLQGEACFPGAHAERPLTGSGLVSPSVTLALPIGVRGVAAAPKLCPWGRNGCLCVLPAPPPRAVGPAPHVGVGASAQSGPLRRAQGNSPLLSGAASSAFSSPRVAG